MDFKSNKQNSKCLSRCYLGFSTQVPGRRSKWSKLDCEISSKYLNLHSHKLLSLELSHLIKYLMNISLILNVIFQNMWFVTAVLYLTAGTRLGITKAECLAYDHRLNADAKDTLSWLLAWFYQMGLLPSHFKPHVQIHFTVLYF